MTVLLRLTRAETRLFLREPISVVFALLFPPVLYAVLGSVPSFQEAEEGLGGLRVIDLYTPIVVALAFTVPALTNLPQQFATYRERGVLRRMRTTPVRPAVMLGAQMLMYTCMSVATMLVILALGRVAFDVDLPQLPLAYIAAHLLTSLAVLAIGLLVGAVAPSGTSAGAIGFVLLLPMLFFAGLWTPRETMPDVLRTISDATPLGAGVQSLQDAAAGDWPHLLHLAVLLGWTVAAGALAARYFRWE
ncbi:ABC transporter permease [Nocardiopsis sp. HNM0947]|uniref:Transport permease protein n=1 Tax=Nocardiopsis coralli TaxID=2772213 RepID=A0ABR9PD93_9ACTN|nr:ABC transporter permease [Nocardiopsis coralli]MBE3001787.1 ABC transporter permease [Nocardiopsis coralli]